MHSSYTASLSKWLFSSYLFNLIHYSSLLFISKPTGLHISQSLHNLTYYFSLMLSKYIIREKLVAYQAAVFPCCLVGGGLRRRCHLTVPSLRSSDVLFLCYYILYLHCRPSARQTTREVNSRITFHF